jgi:integrase
MHTGMRPSEAAGLTGGNIDLDAWLVKRYVTKTDMRCVSLTQKATETLQSIRPEDALGSTLVFLHNDSNLTMLLKNRPNLYFRKAYDTVLKKAGLEDVHLHDLRHTAASLPPAYGWI